MTVHPFTILITDPDDLAEFVALDGTLLLAHLNGSRVCGIRISTDIEAVAFKLRWSEHIDAYNNQFRNTQLILNSIMLDGLVGDFLQDMLDKRGNQ